MSNPRFIIKMKNGGVICGELYPDAAPITVRNFAELANAGFYDGDRFWSVIPEAQISCGYSNAKTIKGEFRATPQNVVG